MYRFSNAANMAYKQRFHHRKRRAAFSSGALVEENRESREECTAEGCKPAASSREEAFVLPLRYEKNSNSSGSHSIWAACVNVLVDPSPRQLQGTQ